jgi:hypothetical protein
MDYAYQITSIAKNIALVAMAVAAFVYLHEARQDGKQLRVIVVEQKGLLDRLRGDMDLFKRRSEEERKGLLERLANLERRGDSGEEERAD